MDAKDIQIDEYYAVGGHHWCGQSHIRRGQVIRVIKATTAYGDSRCTVRFRQPMVHMGRYLKVDKTQGALEIELNVDCVFSTWEEHKTKKKERHEAQERLERETTEIRQTLDELRDALHTLGCQPEEYLLANDTRYRDEQTIACGRLLLSHAALLTILEALEKLQREAAPGSVVVGLLEEK
jgi:hypothetical protein